MGSTENYTSTLQARAGRLQDAETVLQWVNDRALWRLDDPEDFRRRKLSEFAPVWSEMVAQHAVWLLEYRARKGKYTSVGQIGWTWQSQNTAEVFITLPNPGVRRQGHGNHWMAWLESRARERSISQLTAKVLASNHAGVGFFASLGYQVDHRSTVYLQREGEPHALLSLYKTLSLTS